MLDILLIILLRPYDVHVRLRQSPGNCVLSGAHTRKGIGGPMVGGP